MFWRSTSRRIRPAISGSTCSSGRVSIMAAEVRESNPRTGIGNYLASVSDFDDLLEANRSFASEFDAAGFDGIARAGVAIVTCIDSRIMPLAMVGLSLGDAKIMRNPGGRVMPQTLDALILAVHLLGVNRILIVPHTRCAMAINSEAEIRNRISMATGKDASGQSFTVVTDQRRALFEDVESVRQHPLVPETVVVGGFMYDVDTGLLDQVI